MSVREMSGVRVVRVEGDLDAENVEAFQQTLREAAGADPEETRKVIIDLEECTFIDSAALGVLFALVSWVRQKGGRIAAVRPPAHVLHILQLVRLTDERGFQVFADLASAQAALQTT